MSDEEQQEIRLQATTMVSKKKGRKRRSTAENPPLEPPTDVNGTEGYGNETGRLHYTSNNGKANALTMVTDNVLNVFDALSVSVSDEDITKSAKDNNAPKKLLTSIDAAAKKMQTGENGTVSLKKTSVGMSVMDVDPDQDGPVCVNNCEFLSAEDGGGEYCKQ
eukprot:sb/3472646/